jgi:Na+-driven multidrug efflux pump
MLDTTLPNLEEPTSSNGKLLSIARVALPTLMTFIFQGLAEVINTCFIGRYLSDPRILAGAGMGNIVITMMCVAVF